MYLLRRLTYYLASIITLLRGIRNWPALLRLLLPGARPVILVLRDGACYAVNSLMDAWIVKETNLDRDYERAGICLQDGWSIVDIGAGMGDFTVFAARRVPHGRVLAYEPAPDSAALLRQNLELNGIANVLSRQAAVASQAGYLNLDTSRGVAVQYRTVGGQGQVSVPAVSLADVLAGLPHGHCDFMKIDCEGAEYDILLNAPDEALAAIGRICLEYHDFVTPYSHHDLARHLASKGWSVRLYPSPVHRELGLLYAENH